MNIFNKDFFKDNGGVSVNIEKSKKNTGKKILSISLAFAIGVGAGISLTTSYNEILKSKDLLNNESASISQNEVMHVSLEDINSLNIIINDSDCSNTFFSEVCKHLQEDGLNFKITSDDMNIDSENAVVITLDQQYLAGPGVMVIAPYENNNTNNSDALALALDAGFDENGFNMEDICCGIAGYKETETGVSTRDNIIRPLIECNRYEIEKYCEENDLNPRIDKTNFENIYTRNKVRNMLIPYIKENFNPNIIESINRLSDLSKQENEYLEKQTEKVYKEILISAKNDEIILDLNKFNLQETVIKSRLVLYTINILFGTRSGIEKKHIEDIIKLCSNNIGNKFLIPNKKVKILVKNKKIFFIANQ